MKNQSKMNEPESNPTEFRILIEISWRRPLNEEEHARLTGWLAAHPEDHAEWETELLITRGLNTLPQAPAVSTNFTALVLQAVEQEERQRRREEAVKPSGSSRLRLPAWLSFWAAKCSSLVRRPAVGVTWGFLITCALWFGYQHHQAAVRHDLIASLAAVASVAALSEPGGSAMLEDLDAIQRFSQATRAEDDDLYSVLSQ